MKGLYTSGLADRPHFVYRVFDGEDRLLYVGCSVNPERPMKQHAYKKAPWVRDAVRWTAEEHADFLKARDAERDAIWFEKPLHNRQLVEQVWR